MALSVLIYTAAAVPSAAAAESDYGRPGEPVYLRVGYQPYFAEAWSGAIIRAFQLHERYLPQGSTVHFEVGTKGAGILVDAIRLGRHSISYLGLAPTAEAINAVEPADIRVIAVAAASSDQCGAILARVGAGAPKTADAASTRRWLAGKRVAVPSKTCADLFLRSVLTAPPPVEVRRIDQNIDLMALSLETAAVDAVALWEPTTSELIARGLAVPLLTGTQVGWSGAAFVVMRNDLMQARPDVALAWAAAERDAQTMLADRTQRAAVIRAIHEQVSGISEGAIAAALDGAEWQDAPVARMRYPFVPEQEARELLAGATASFAAEARWRNADLRPDAIEPAFAKRLEAPGGAQDRRPPSRPR